MFGLQHIVQVISRLRDLKAEKTRVFPVIIIYALSQTKATKSTRRLNIFKYIYIIYLVLTVLYGEQ